MASDKSGLDAGGLAHPGFGLSYRRSKNRRVYRVSRHLAVTFPVALFVFSDFKNDQEAIVAPQPENATIPWIARALLHAKGDLMLAAKWSELNSAPDRALRILKAAASAGTISDPDWAGALADYRIAIGAFVESMRTRSVFYRFLAENAFRRVPLRTRIALTTISATGWIIGESQPMPLSEMNFAGKSLEPIHAAALVVVTAELVQSTTAAGQSLLASELKGAVADVVDEKLFDIALTGITPVASSGSTAAAIAADLRKLLMAVNVVGQTSNLAWVLSPDVANGLAALTTPDGIFIHQNMSPTGGELLNLPALVSNRRPSGTIMLLDGLGFAADSDTIVLDSSGQATVEMSNTPSSDPVLTSLWQHNNAGLLAQAFFGAERLRDNAAAVLTGIEWEA
ncbi:phage major capsid protein [Phyllobacterium sp. YR620]|uniref:phage major capsid protein n=1 Tax=Phyllobacterium sp. YR620 TaxID=1881066 RepID=UPI000B840F59|nr:phage major capsid protein [Phyllobacterium sp. YR620]